MKNKYACQCFKLYKILDEMKSVCYYVNTDSKQEDTTMSNQFDKSLMINNILYLIKQRGVKIGELEMEAGVSPGYISRINKEGNTKPGIDFIYNVSDVLNLDIDTLLKVDISNLTPSVRYMISFLEKLTQDTFSEKLEWNRESKDQLNLEIESDENGNCNHPLFQVKTILQPTEGDYPEEVTLPVFPSQTFDTLTGIEGDCFNLAMNDGVTLYVMNIYKAGALVSDPDTYAKEVWICGQNNEKQFLCSTRDVSRITSLIDRLYSAIVESAKHPTVKPVFRTAIDSFMTDERT